MADVGVTGHLSGLGRHLVSLEGFSPFQNEESEPGKVEFTVHAGYSIPDPRNLPKAAVDVERQIRSTLACIEKTAGLFVYISSIEVYPRRQGVVFSEDTRIDLREIQGHNGLLKLYLEQLVQARAKRFCIIRPGLMVGRFSRPNSVSRLVAGDTGPYTLGSASAFSLVSHDSVGGFIREVVRVGMTGVWNFSSKESISLGEVATIARNPEVQFGSHQYLTPMVDSSRAEAVMGFPLPSPFELVSAMATGQ